MNHKANTVLALAQQYAPDWALPEAVQWFRLSDTQLETLFSASLPTLQIERGIWNDRLEAIEDGSYYNDNQRGIGLESYYNAQRKEINRSTKFTLDRCEAYHMVYHIDTMIQVHTR